MDIFELTRKFEQISTELEELRKRVEKLESLNRNYPQYSPVEWPPITKWVPATYPHHFPTVICSTGEKV